MSWKGGLSSGCVCVQVREGSRLVEHNGFLQGRYRGMVRGVEEEEVFGLDSPQGWRLRGLWSWKPENSIFTKGKRKYL